MKASSSTARTSEEPVAAAREVAAATQTDRGCLAYSFPADVEDPDRVIGIEVWADQVALDEHMGHRHTQDFLRVAPGLVTGEPVMAFHHVPDDRTSAPERQRVAPPPGPQLPRGTAGPAPRARARHASPEAAEEPRRRKFERLHGTGPADAAWAGPAVVREPGAGRSSR